MTTRTRPEGCCPLQGVAPLPSREQERWARLFKALADPTRLEILRLVAAQPGPTCVCDLVARFDLAQPTISHHLRLLRRAGLVVVQRRGLWAHYTVVRPALDARRRQLREYLDHLTAYGSGTRARRTA